MLKFNVAPMCQNTKMLGKDWDEMAQVGVISFLLKNVSCVQFLSDW
jgi:hypothetical protein